jgi:predicted SAM-dependent methyltransferase
MDPRLKKGLFLTDRPMNVDFDPNRWPKRLNLGCGWDHRQGYVNVDLHEFHRPDLIADVTQLDMLPDGYYSEVCAIDVLEHLPRHMTEAALSEWNRVLALGGRLLLRVPSLFDLVDCFRRRENLAPERQRVMMQCLFGTQAYTGDTHLTSFTRPLLEHQLKDEGFEVESLSLRDEWLFEVEAIKVARSEYATRWAHYSDLLSITDPRDFVTAAYERILGRPPDPSGEYHYSSALESGACDRRRMIEELERSPESSLRHN